MSVKTVADAVEETGMFWLYKIFISLLICIHFRHTASLHTLTWHHDCICRMWVGVGQIANRTAAIGRECSCITCIPRRTRQWCTRMCIYDRRLRHLFTTRNGCAGGFCLCFTIHGAALVRLLARATTVAVASLSTIRLHQRFRVVCQKQAHLIAVVTIVVLLNEPGSLASITMLISQYDGNISNIHLLERSSDFFRFQLDVEVTHIRHLNAILAAMRSSKFVESVEREKI